MSIYIISVDNQINGYLTDEKQLAICMAKLVDDLIAKIDRSVYPETKIFTEKLENGCKIYRQNIGKYFNGIVECIHHITFQQINHLNF